MSSAEASASTSDSASAGESGESSTSSSTETTDDSTSPTETTDDPTDDPTETTDDPTDDPTGTETGTDTDTDTDTGMPDQGAPPPCPPPDMLILLDRSMGMGRTVSNVWPPDDAWDTSKLWGALEVMDAIVSQFEDQVRFGLALFPGDAGEDICSPIDDPCWQNNSQDTCKTGNQWLCNEPLAEQAIDFALSNGPAFAELDPLTLPVCFGTPTAAGVDLGVELLSPLADQVHQQAAILITDGSAHCGDLVAAVHDLVNTTEIALYIIGYSDDDMASWVALLNDAACAAQTSINFPEGCVEEGDGWVAETPNGPPLFYPVADPAQFEAVMTEITTTFDCVVG